MKFYNLLQLGGPLMFVLLAVSIFALLIVVAKIIQFRNEGVFRLFADDIFIETLRAKNITDCREMLNGEVTCKPLVRTVKVALEYCEQGSNSSSQIYSEIQRIGSREVRNLETLLRELSAIAYVSPLIGLLGTVIGMIAAFSELQSAGTQISPALLAGGIWEALLTTAFGLCIAIVSLTAFYYFEGVIDSLQSRINDVITQVLIHYNVSKTDLA